MHFTSLFVVALGASTWLFDTVRDPLGQPIYVAQIEPEAERPHVAMRFLCGGITGVVLQFNLGDTRYTSSMFSRAEPEWEQVKFVFDEGPYETEAKRAPITDGLGTYEIKGSDAAFVAKLFRSGGRVSVQRRTSIYNFTLEGAHRAIGEVMTLCPYRYEND